MVTKRIQNKEIPKISSKDEVNIHLGGQSIEYIDKLRQMSICVVGRRLQFVKPARTYILRRLINRVF